MHTYVCTYVCRYFLSASCAGIKIIPLRIFMAVVECTTCEFRCLTAVFLDKHRLYICK